MDATAQQTAFVFAGGGSLGAVQVGMLRALFATELRPDFVVGSSVGAINAAYLAANPTPDGVADLEALWRSVPRRDVFPLSFTRLAALFFHPDYVVESDGLRAIIERRLPYASLQDARIPVHIVATDQQGTCVVLSQGSAVEAILASTAIPGIYPPVRVDGNWLMDGAISADTPILRAIELGATRVVVFPTGYACALKAPPRGVVAKALHAITDDRLAPYARHGGRPEGRRARASRPGAMSACRLALRLLRDAGADRARRSLDAPLDRPGRAGAAGRPSGTGGAWSLTGTRGECRRLRCSSGVDPHVRP